VKLETTNFELEIRRLEAILAQNQASLNKLIAGATEEDIRVFETKVYNAEISLEEAKKNIIDKLQDAYTKSDDAIRNKVDQFMSNPRSANPGINLPSSGEAQLESDIKWERMLLENKITTWNSLVENLSVSDNLQSILEKSQTYLGEIRQFLDKVALLLTSVSADASLSQTTLDGYRSDVSTARTNINTAVTNITTAEEKLRTAEPDLLLANKKLTLKKAGARSEDIEITKAKIEEIESRIAIIREKIKKSTIYAPITAKVLKIWLEKQELFRSGQTAVSLSASGHKIQADISELEIGKISKNKRNDVSIKLDAFPDEKLKGKVVSIEPKEIIKDGDKYYRVNIYAEPHGLEIRSGMSADLTIHISSKNNVLKIPEFAVYEKNGKKFVEILEEKERKEIEIETGISDGESIEIIKGLNEGQTVIVSAD
jgi:RND family efflux transporter MFP subunit